MFLKKALKFFGLAWLLKDDIEPYKGKPFMGLDKETFNKLIECKTEDEIHILTRDEYKNKSKTQLVLDHLQKYGSITSEGFHWYYKYDRGSAIIYKLKKRGFNIKTHTHHFVEGNGKKKSMKVYVLIK